MSRSVVAIPQQTDEQMLARLKALGLRPVLAYPQNPFIMTGNYIGILTHQKYGHITTFELMRGGGWMVQMMLTPEHWIPGFPKDRFQVFGVHKRNDLPAKFYIAEEDLPELIALLDAAFGRRTKESVSLEELRQHDVIDSRFTSPELADRFMKRIATGPAHY